MARPVAGIGYLYLNPNNNNNHHDEIDGANGGFDTIHHHYDWLVSESDSLAQLAY